MNYFDITIFKGQTYGQAFTITGADGSGLNFNSSGFSIKNSIKIKYSDTGDYNNFISNISSPESGQIILSLASTGSTGMAIGKYLYDVELFSGNNVFKALQGRFYINPTST